MFLPEEYYANNIIVYYSLSLEGFGSEEQFLSYLRIEEQEKYFKIIAKEVKHTYLVSHAFLNKLFSELLKIEIKNITINYHQFGKPSIQNTNYKFNLSHSGHAWCLAITKNQEVGIDIEKVKPCYAYLNDIVSSYFSPKEIAYVGNSINKEKEFIYIWTRKEAALKASGLGLGFSLKDLDVVSDTHLTHIKNNKYQLSSFSFGDYYISVASEEKTNLILKRVSLLEFM